MIEHHDEAVGIARKALMEIFPLLPDRGLRNPSWAGQRIEVDGRTYYVAVSPWWESEGGRYFTLWPGTPAGRPRVDGFVGVSTSGLDIQPSLFRRQAGRKKAPRS